MTDTIKVTILGPINVGKTSILERLSNNYLSLISEPTVGMYHRKVTISGIDFSVWDTAGEERYRSMTDIYYRNAHIIIFVFEVSKPETINSMCEFIQDAMLKSNAHKSQIHFIIVGNKIDILHPEYEELIGQFRKNPVITQYALENLSIIFMSARTGFGCNRLEARMIELANIKIFDITTDVIKITTSTVETGSSCQC